MTEAGPHGEKLTLDQLKFADAFFEISMLKGMDVGVAPLAFRRAFPQRQGKPDTLARAAYAFSGEPAVRRYIAWRRTNYASRTTVPVTRLIEELERIAVSNLADFIKIDPVTGKVSIDIRENDASQLAAVAELIITPKGEARLRFHDKHTAIQRLGSVHGLFGEKLDVTLTLSDVQRALKKMRDRMAGTETIDEKSEGDKT